jgi:peptide/nickel transport system substrate-binding protein
MRTSTRRCRAIAIAAALSLTAAACGGDDDNDSGGAASDSSEAEANDDGSSDDAEPSTADSSMEDGSDGSDTDTEDGAAEPATDNDDSSAGAGGDLRVSGGAAVNTLDPHGDNSVDNTTAMIASHYMDSLVRRTPDGELVPRLATEWTTTDENTWVFTLRDDATFHDGTPVTAADVVASVERIIALDGPAAPQWERLVSVEAIDDTTVQFNTSEPLGTLPTVLAVTWIGPAAGISEDGFWDKPIGSGPFMVDTFAPDETLRLVRYDDYWDGAASLDSLEFVDVPEVSSRLTGLETGELHMTWEIPPDQVPTAEGLSDVVVEKIPALDLYFMWFNNAEAPLDNVDVRTAIRHAVNVQALVDNLFGDMAAVATGPLPSTVFGYSELEPFPYDPELAAQLLADAGFADGFDLTIDFNTGSAPLIREVATQIASDLAAVNISVTLNEVERAEWVERLLALEWEGNLMANSTGTGDADFTLGRLYTCEAERLGYCNPEYDELVNAAKGEVDQDAREELYAQAAAILWEDSVALFLADMNVAYAWRDEVQGFTPDPAVQPWFYPVSLDG